MSENGTQLMILVPGSTGYIYTLASDTLAPISDADFIAIGANYVSYVDGFFAVNGRDSWNISAIKDGTIWNALDVGTAESDPDKIVTPVVVNNRIGMIGSQVTEFFQNAGGTYRFPFQRDNTFIDKGCPAPLSVVNANQTFYMVGKSPKETPSIWQYVGNGFKKISTIAIDTVLAGYTSTDIGNITGFSYAQKGAHFVGFVCPDTTFILNVGNSRWFERKTKYSDIQLPTQWRVAGMCEAYNKIIVFDNRDGRIGELKTDEYSEYGNDIYREVTLPPIYSENNKPFSIPPITLTMEFGVGNSTVTEPQIGLSLSKDGRNFSPARMKSVGKIGEYTKEITWRMNGKADRFVIPRLTTTDQAKMVVIKMEI
jgi:hypothetical protein